MKTTDILIEYAKLLSEAPKIALREGISLFKARSCVTEDETAEITYERGAPQEQLADPATDQITQYWGSYLVKDTNVVPIPAALPLFAAGLGAMGFMGWCRKRKAAVAG